MQMQMEARTVEGRAKIKSAIKRRLTVTGRNATELAELVGCTPEQARVALEALIEEGIAKRVGKTKATRFLKN